MSFVSLFFCLLPNAAQQEEGSRGKREAPFCDRDPRKGELIDFHQPVSTNMGLALHNKIGWQIGSYISSWLPPLVDTGREAHCANTQFCQGDWGGLVVLPL